MKKTLGILALVAGVAVIVYNLFFNRSDDDSKKEEAEETGELGEYSYDYANVDIQEETISGSGDVMVNYLGGLLNLAGQKDPNGKGDGGKDGVPEDEKFTVTQMHRPHSIRTNFTGV